MRSRGCRKFGTAALHLALDATGVKDGDEVIVPTMTFGVTPEVVFYLRAKPVLVNCRLESFNIDPEDIERKVTSKTKAIIPVDMAGQPCEFSKILDLARIHNLKVIEDAAHALPAACGEKKVGTISDITCFPSMQPKESRPVKGVWQPPKMLNGRIG